MKQIRRSLNKDREQRSGYGGQQSPPLPSPGGFRPSAGQQVLPPSSRLAPPKLVIRAIETYRARAPNELSFSNGDFFHVVSDPRANDSDYFDAANPATGARGLVPKAMFQVLGRNEREQGRSAGSAVSPTSVSPGQSPSPPNLSPQAVRANGMTAMPSAGASRGPAGPGGPQSLYGVVQYDFEAQRSDELEAKKGEPIIIIAQSNHEWFVAKPIGRLGGPGLIPVSFVEIQNMATGKPLDPTVVNEMIKGGALPPVEEWKKMTAEYKQQSIPLGRFDFATTSQPQSQHPFDGHKSAPGQSQARLQQSGGRQTSSAYETSNGRLAPLAYPPQHASHSSPSLITRPEERNSGSSAPRRSDQYGHQQEDSIDQLTPDTAFDTLGLVVQSAVESFHFEDGAFWFHVHCAFATGASYIIYRLYEDFHAFQVALMAEFPIEAGRELPPGSKPHDQLKRIIPKMPGPAAEVDEVLCAQRVEDLSVYLSELCRLPDYMMASPIVYDFFLRRPGDLEVAPPPVAKKSNSSRRTTNDGPAAAEHDVVEYLGSMQGQGGSSGSNSGTNSRATADAQDLRRGVESMRVRDQDEYRSSQRSSAARSDLERQRQSGARSAASQHSQTGRSTTPQTTGQQQAPLRADTTSSNNSSSRRPGSYGVTSPVSTAPTSASTSASAPAAAAPSFIKIKIFHRSTDDLIAIRVPPNVTFAALLDKARDRLGEEIGKLRFKEEIAGLPNVVGMPGNGARLVEISSDADLQRWLSIQNAKLILYADRA